MKNLVESGRDLTGFERSILRLKARLSMNRNEPTAADLSRAAADVDMTTLGAAKTVVEMLEAVKDEIEGTVLVRAYSASITVLYRPWKMSLEPFRAQLDGVQSWEWHFVSLSPHCLHVED